MVNPKGQIHDAVEALNLKKKYFFDLVMSIIFNQALFEIVFERFKNITTIRDTKIKNACKTNSTTMGNAIWLKTT